MTSPDKREPVDAYLTRIFGADIQPGREARILADDTRLAGEVQGRLDAEPLAEGVHAPITLALPRNLAPIAYIIHVWTHKCSLCNTEHKHSEVFALNHLRSRTGAGHFVRNMTPAAAIEWQVPLQVHNLTTRVTAGCFECLDAIRDEVMPHLPKPPVPDAVLKGTEGASTPNTSPKGPKPKTPSTTDDFML